MAKHYEENEPKCTNCNRNIDLGADLLAIEEGVLGPRGFVPLAKTLFCSEKCLREYFCNSKLTDIPERIP